MPQLEEEIGCSSVEECSELVRLFGRIEDLATRKKVLVLLEDLAAETGELISIEDIMPIDVPETA
jgi:hypothetical protein